ncbi:MAG: hypothetical protein AAGD32_08555 [Planctomycetota bacterium]
MAQVETDLFCNECGFNLHAQRVWRDERLDLLLCRCPECGRHHPAGQVVSATRPWLRRFGILLLSVWVLGVIGFVLACGAAQFGMLVAHHEGFCSYGQMTRDGRLVTREWRVDATGNGMNVTLIDGVEIDVANQMMPPTTYTMIPPGLPGHRDRIGNDAPMFLTFMITIFVLGSVVPGSVLTIALGHRRRVWPWAVGAVVTLISVGLFMGIVWSVENMRLTAPWMTRWAMAYMAIAWAALAVTVWLARPIARAVLTLFLPLQARRTFSFLWSADGKALP